jgi:UDP-N-acetylglucosamine pyrophosphorylase
LEHKESTMTAINSNLFASVDDESLSFFCQNYFAMCLILRTPIFAVDKNTIIIAINGNGWPAVFCVYVGGDNYLVSPKLSCYQ